MDSLRTVLVALVALAMDVPALASDVSEDQEQPSMEFTPRLPASAPRHTLWDSPLSEAAELEYEQYVRRHKLADTLTAKELERYKYRYFSRATKQARAMDFHSGSRFERAQQHEKWERGLGQALAEELPAVTEHLVDQVNGASTDWKAEAAEWSQDLTMQDAHVLMGYVPEPEIANTTLESFPEHLRRLKEMPAYFDSRDQWPHCREVFGHIRNQGKCGSCWAQAAAGSIDGRLCIASDGRFSGPQAWTSAGYMTSCYNMLIINGCMGGNPGWALSRIRQSFLPFMGGVPTGSEHEDTCVPYFGSGDALQHFNGNNMKAPKCPASCTFAQYPRSLFKDRFFTTGMVSATTDLSFAKRALMEGGPIPVAFTVYQDLMAYSSGYYQRTTSKKMGGHAVNLLGWELYKGDDYLLAANSWGTKWGEQGMFKMKATCCEASYFIANVADRQKALPLPDGPSTPTAQGGTNNSGRRRRKPIIWNPFARHSSTAGEFSDSKVFALAATSNHETPASNLTEAPARVRFSLEVANVSCATLTSAERLGLELAIATAIVGKLDVLLPEGVVEDTSGHQNRVTVLACFEGLCEEHSAGASGILVAFYILLPSIHNAVSERQAVQSDAGLLSAVEARTIESLQARGGLLLGGPRASWKCSGPPRPITTAEGTDNNGIYSVISRQALGESAIIDHLFIIGILLVITCVCVGWVRIQSRSANPRCRMDKRSFNFDDEVKSPASDTEAQEQPLVAMPPRPMQQAAAVPVMVPIQTRPMGQHSVQSPGPPALEVVQRPFVQLPLVRTHPHLQNTGALLYRSQAAPLVRI